MFRANYKATIKSILRSPVTLLAFGAAVILTLAFYRAYSFGDLAIAALRSRIWNHIRVSCILLFSPFVGLMISAHILSEQQNGLGDLLVSSRKSILSIYLSKLCAVSTVALVARLMYFTVAVLWFWNIHYPDDFASIGLSLPLGEILSFYAVHEVIYMPFLLLCYTAMPVFVSVITNVPAAGAVWNVGFYLLGVVVTPLSNTNFYLPPSAMDDYLITYNFIDTPEYMKALQAGLIPNALGLGRVPPSLQEALTAYIAWIVFSLALLIASYFILKRRYRT